MEATRFAWDRRKAAANRRKHGVSFEEAATAFADENGRIIYNPHHSRQEDRFVLLGLSARPRLLIVCHAYRRNDGEIRIISARQATAHERTQYRSHL